MSQLITALPVGTCVKLQETVNGTTRSEPWVIIAKNDTNPYGNDNVLCIRQRVVDEYGRGNFGNYNKYENSKADNYLKGTFLSWFSNEQLYCIATSTVKCFDETAQENYTIGRVFFLPSYNEMGGNLQKDPSGTVSFFTTDASRVENSNSYHTRTFSSVTAIYDITAAGGFASRNITAGSYTQHACLRPACNIFATTLVSDEPDEDGYYALIPDPDDPYLYVRFDASLGSVAKTPLKIRVDLTTEGNPEVTSLQVCNNYGDTNPTWETMTLGEAHTFTNTTKTTANWEIGVKVEARGENTIRVYEPFAIIQTEVD